MYAALLVTVGAAVGMPLGYVLRAWIGRSILAELASLRERLVELEVMLALLKPTVDILHRLSLGQPSRSASGTGNFPAIRDP